jgi:hypothetical protein
MMSRLGDPLLCYDPATTAPRAPVARCCGTRPYGEEQEFVMDDRGFDHLARALARPAPRRVALAAGLGGLARVLRHGAASAKGRAKPEQPGNGDHPPGHGTTPPGHGGTPPGQGGTPPGQAPGACAERACSIVTACGSGDCAPGAFIKDVKLIVDNRVAVPIAVEFWHKDGRGCHQDRSLTLGGNATTDYASGALNAFAWINGRYGVEGDNPPIGTPFVNLVHGGSMTADRCYTLGALDLQVRSLGEGEGVQRTIEEFTFEIFRLADTDDDKVFRLTVRSA